MVHENFAGFRVLKLRYSANSHTEHTIYMKEHSVREYNTARPPGRTLFVLNVPPFITEEQLQHIFERAGDIESILLQDKPSSSETNVSSIDKTSFKVAYVVFKKKSDLISALNNQHHIPIYEENASITGAARWIKEYNSSIPKVDDLKKYVETNMKKYDEEKNDKLENAKSLGEADDEGWVTVTRHSKKPGFERKESVGNKIMAKEKMRQQKKELKNFYSFQIRESKMNHIITLRQKFEEDKKKIALLKESRRFRPF